MDHSISNERSWSIFHWFGPFGVRSRRDVYYDLCSMAAKPIEKWRSTRDKCIAAAEVATRNGSLQTAVKYLEQAAMWSSKD